MISTLQGATQTSKERASGYIATRSAMVAKYLLPSYQLSDVNLKMVVDWMSKIYEMKLWRCNSSMFFAFLSCRDWNSDDTWANFLTVLCTECIGGKNHTNVTTHTFFVSALLRLELRFSKICSLQGKFHKNFIYWIRIKQDKQAKFCSFLN